MVKKGLLADDLHEANISCITLLQHQAREIFRAMTTPGRTHLPWETQTGQVQELLNYISFLEAKLQYLQFHHETCDKGSTQLPLSFNDLSYIPPDLVDANDSDFYPSIALEYQEPLVSTNDSQIVQPTPKVPPSNARWRRIIDQMTKGWDQPSSWMDRRIAIGLDTVEENHYALTMLLGLKNELSGGHGAGSGTEILDFPMNNKGVSETLIMSARRYALGTKASERDAGFVVQLHNFRELVFASLCVVIEHQGLPTDAINDLMRICMSSSGAANLYRLRRGALWVNRVIAGLIRKGWRHCATEFFLLSGRPVSQYGLLWEGCVHSFPYLSERLAYIYETVEQPLPEPGWIPFSIPSIIKGLVGDALTLGQICTALDYEEESLSKLFLDVNQISAVT
ncbi:hypothetical protein ONS95_002034 [Cadophora gregata]|uniref:uncharacterized protein n=1 Tax=Cadophora gregata TaxID=51156 RepID=UPI0026DB4DD2|nr:uncharacterized protein ONS95_002034 [Cadophora gregata]KAK0111689.1 hypothetical protein ONS95_002034 [Cadophora gregata]KAK0111833.1 hypothetical protein ONS96_001102 [Cadophora gregata f. sp. sojae]